MLQSQFLWLIRHEQSLVFFIFPNLATDFARLNLIDSVRLLWMFPIVLNPLHAICADVIGNPDRCLRNISTQSRQILSFANSANDFFENAPVALTTIVDCATGIPVYVSEIF
jgi:hypothetical protein